jgi:hypothetical protein
MILNHIQDVLRMNPGYDTNQTQVSCSFLQSQQATDTTGPHMKPWSLPHPFLFIIHYHSTIQHYTVRTTNIVLSCPYIRLNQKQNEGKDAPDAEIVT